MVSEQHSSHSNSGAAVSFSPVLIHGFVSSLIIFKGVGVGPTVDRTERMRAHEYSNSCPHFKQTWYVRFLIVNTPLLWR